MNRTDVINFLFALVMTAFMLLIVILFISGMAEGAQGTTVYEGSPYQDHITVHTNAPNAEISINEGSWEAFNGYSYSYGSCHDWQNVRIRAEGYQDYEMPFYCDWLYVSHYVVLEVV